MRRFLAALSLTVVIILTGCGDEGADPATLQVVATTSIWGDVVGQITHDDADVTVLIPRGADPHDYEASARQAAAIATADLVVVNGLGLEEGLGDVLEAARSDGARIVELAPLLDPLPFPSADDAAGADLDPHVWFDPARVGRAAEIVAAQLANIEPSIDWMGRAGAYRAVLDEAGSQMTEIFTGIPANRRKLVTNHDALGYLAHTFDLTVVGVVIPGGSSLGEPSSAGLAGLVDAIKENDVPAIFAESDHAHTLAEAVAAEVGRHVAVVELYTGSLAESGSTAGTLAGMLVEDATRIADSLK